MTATPEQIKEALIRNNGIWPDSETCKALKEAGCMYTVMPLPENFKERFKFLSNILVQMVFSSPRKGSKLEVELHAITTSLSYLINSSSYRDEKYHDYDQAEINRKLRR